MSGSVSFSDAAYRERYARLCRAVWALLRFATYRGVGAHTSYGMGRMRLDERAAPAPRN